jgi:hypothetical protein
VASSINEGIVTLNNRRFSMFSGILGVGGLIGGIVTAILGVIILVWPRLISTIIGIWLIIVGILAIIASR